MAQGHETVIKNAVRENASDRDGHAVSVVTVEPGLRPGRFVSHVDKPTWRRMQIERWKGFHRIDDLFECCAVFEVHANRDHVAVNDIYSKTLSRNRKICLLNAAVGQYAQYLSCLGLDLWLLAGNICNDIVHNVE